MLEIRPEDDGSHVPPPEADEAWQETGVGPRQPKIIVAAEMQRLSNAETPRHTQQGNNGEMVRVYAEGMLVRHEMYGQGRVTHVSGYGVMRKIKVRFSTHGEKTFVANKAKLAIIGK